MDDDDVIESAEIDLEVAAIVEILEAHRVPWSPELATALWDLKEVLLESQPPRKFVDDLGRRWEYCGGVEGTWAWRITGYGPWRITGYGHA